MTKRDCRSCIYCNGKLSNEERFVWSQCDKGIANLTMDSAEKCNHYAGTLQEALRQREIEFRAKQLAFAKKYGREWDYRCPCCGGWKKGGFGY